MDSDPLERIREMARGILEFEGMEFVHLEMKNQGDGACLRIYIDREGGVTLDDCSRVSRRLSAELDIEDPLTHSYRLEVSSPGLDRPLFSDADFSRFAGRMVRLRTAVARDGRRRFTGRLIGIINGVVQFLLDGDQELVLPRREITEARIAPDLENGPARGGRKGRQA